MITLDMYWMGRDHGVVIILSALASIVAILIALAGYFK